LENIQREDLNPLEAAEAYKRLQDEFKLTRTISRNAVGKERSTITNFLRILSLPKEVNTRSPPESLSMGHAKALLSSSVSVISSALRLSSSKGLSVREAESSRRASRTAKREKGPPEHELRAVQRS